MKTILVIDDQIDNLITIKAIIKSYIKNCEVSTALSGSEGIKMAKEKLPDTILLDIIMPDMDGYEVCERLKADIATKHIPIIMVTAIKTDTENRIKGLNIGADAFLSKPIDPAELSAQINVMFRVKEAEDKLRTEKDELDLLVFQRNEELRESEEKFKNAILLSPNPIMIHDEDNNVLQLSKGWTELSGYDIEDIPTLGDWTEKAYGERKDFAQEYIEDLFKINTTVNNGEWIVKSKNGKKLIWEFSTTPLGKFGDNKKVLLSNAIDITGRKKSQQAIIESEERLKLIFDYAPDAIYLNDFKGTFIDCNKAAEKMLGYTKTELIGKNFIRLNILSVKHISFATDSLAKSVMGKRSGPDEFLLTRKDGTNILVEISTYPVKIKGKKIVLGVARDITERKKVEQSLKESEEKYRDTVNLLPQIVYEINSDGILTYINDQAIEVTGYSREELDDNFNVIDIILPEQQKRAKESIYNIIKNNKAGNPEFTIVKKDGSFFHALLFSSAIYKNNKKVGLRGVIIDITYQKEAEEKVLESKNRFKSLMQQAPFVVEIYDIDGLQISVNKAYEDIWGFPAKTTVNKFNVLKSKEVVNSGLIDYVNRAYAGEAVTAPEYEFNPTGDTEAKGKGRVRWLSTRIYPLKDELGKVKNIVIIHQDITEKKYAKLLQRVIFNISNAVATTDNLNKLIGIIKNELGTIIDTSNFYVALYDKASDSFSFPYYADEKDEFKTAPAQKTLSKYVIDTKKPLLANIALKNKFKEEGILDFQGSLSKIWLGVPLMINDVSIGAFAVQSYTDENAYNETDLKMLEFVSDQISLSIHRKIAEDKLKAALVKAEESDRLKTAFLANMSHEIRTPMNGILGFADLLSTPGLDGDEIKEYTKIIKRSGNRMLNIINNLIDISKIEAGQMKLIMSKCNINTQIEYLYTFFNPEATKKGLNFSLATTLPNREAIIETDREKIYAILTNLIKNAIKYTKYGYIEFGYEKKGEMLEFYVKDSGIGIPKNRQKAIFERFIQADIDDTEVYEGAGLGLAIITAYIEMLGGKIWVNSKENVGSQFYFTIPYKTNQKTENTEQKKEHPDPVITPKNLKILIAEDEYVADDLLTIILSKFSTNILHAKTGIETVKIAKENPDIAFILMDIKMPIMDGYTATRKIRKFNKDVKIIAQTAFALTGDRDRAIEAGCDDYISKPINRKELIEKINYLL